MARSRTVVIALVVVVAVMLRALDVSSAVLVSLGNALYFDALVTASATPGEYPHHDVSGIDTTRLNRARSLFQATLTLDSVSDVARWSKGRASLALGDYSEAMRTLAGLESYTGSQPFLYQDVLTAYSYTNQAERFISLYERVGPLPKRSSLSNETVALAYLQRSAPSDLEEAAVYRESLFITYQFWQQAVSTGTDDRAAALKGQLQHFPLSAVNPDDERLLEYELRIIPDLLQNDIWSRTKAVNIVSYLVWRYNDRTSTKELIERLIDMEPGEPEWRFYLAELHHRQGNHLSRLLQTRTSPQCAAASLLNVSSEDISVDDNLLVNSSFNTDDTGELSGWHWSVAANRAPWAEGIFVGGPDRWNEGARVQGLWIIEAGPGEEGARAGYWQRVSVNKPGIYLLSAQYLTEQSEQPRPNIWIGVAGKKIDDYFLPSTDMSVQQGSILFAINKPSDIDITMRNWGTGSVIFTQAELRRVESPTVNVSSFDFPLRYSSTDDGERCAEDT